MTSGEGCPQWNSCRSRCWTRTLPRHSSQVLPMAPWGELHEENLPMQQHWEEEQKTPWMSSLKTSTMYAAD